MKSAAAKRPRFKNAHAPRHWITQYAGVGGYPGYCMSRESAITAAVGHVVNDGYRLAVVTGPDGVAVRIWYDYARKRIVIVAEKHLHRPTNAPTRRKVE